MIQQLKVYESPRTDPHYNLAIESRLLDTVRPGCCILYLWQNSNTVVIGSNQNPWRECRLSLLESAGGKLARRLSGGGAVYHDLGNLNFTFIMCEEDYNIEKQLSVIQSACEILGICAESSGRNDLLVDGRKFSGNAFYHHDGKAYHHGTLLINADMDKMQRFLSPPKAKLESKGVSSVRARVVNLSELYPGLTCDTMKTLMRTAFEKVYSAPCETLVLSKDDLVAIQATQQKFSGWEYLYGKPLPFSFSCEDRFSWGHISVQLHVESGIVVAAKIYSDAMDHTIAPCLEQSLKSCRFSADAIINAISSSQIEPLIMQDILNMINEQNI